LWFEPLYVVEETTNAIAFGIMNNCTAICLQEDYLDIISTIRAGKLAMT
jgi:hypothetical protein